MQELIDRTNKMSYWLGFTWSSLHTLVADNSVAECQKETIRNVLALLDEGINNIFYVEKEHE